MEKPTKITTSLRRALIMQIFEGTNQIQRLVISRGLALAEK
nr:MULTISPECIES: acyl-CoA dehydrogenase family protein [unclassified Streptomyces]